MSSPERAESWATVRAVFEEVVEYPVGERAARLQALCGKDEVLRSAVAELLEADAETGLHTAGALHGLGDSPAPGVSCIGSYTIERVLGSGGMSTVYLARQERPSREVALKTMRAGFAGDEARRRFAYEAEVLARLRHPAIAQVFEVGTWVVPPSMQDQPFFAMELVVGARSLTDYCQQERLDVPKRLTLFCEVCDAVQHGHRSGFLHRDLKPGNILVDEAGRPKVIDFGIARALDDGGQGGAGASLQTQPGSILGTLEYMAPEQLDPGAFRDSEVSSYDARVDVYALGVVLYELLCARRPFVNEPGLGLTEFVRRVRFGERPRPSLRMSSGNISNDLDWVVRAALAASPDERYGSVAEFVADIRRVMADEPVSVGPPTSGYRIRKFVRRNRALVAGVVLFVLALVGGGVSTTVQMLRAQGAERTALALADEKDAARRLAQTEAERARNEADRARRETARAEVEVRKAEAINDFLVGILEAADPHESSAGRGMTVRDALDRAVSRLERSNRFAAQPEVEAAVRFAIGNALRSLHDDEASARQLERVVQIRRELVGEGEPTVDLGQSLNVLGLTYKKLGRPDEAISLMRQAFEVFVRIRGEDDFESGRVAINIGSQMVARGDLDAGDEWLGRAVAILEKHASTRGGVYAAALSHRAILAQNRGDEDSAVRAYERAVAAYDLCGKGEHPFASMTCNRLGNLLIRAERHRDAVPWLERAVRNFGARVGPEDPSFVVAKAALGGALVRTSSPGSEARSRAEDLLRDALGVMQRSFDSANGYRLDAQATYIAVLLSREAFEEALELAHAHRRDAEGSDVEDLAVQLLETALKHAERR